MWTVTIINTGLQIRTAMEQWMNMLSKLDNATGATNPSSYMVDAFVHQLGGIGKNSTGHGGENTQYEAPLEPTDSMISSQLMLVRLICL